MTLPENKKRADELITGKRFSHCSLAGLWRDRDDMADVEAWVRQLRKARTLTKPSIVRLKKALAIWGAIAQANDARSGPGYETARAARLGAESDRGCEHAKARLSDLWRDQFGPNI